MVKIKNNSEQFQSVVGIEGFQPQETKEVSKEDAERLLRNPNFVEGSGKGKKPEAETE